eukprot:CAMPEP_0174274876 /NCGR_PEP_ID=MMETSP0439-20130205/59511_1 /TAXON_ID=0 /ORGANISM="Stereomyxa ramosa, Strain Chinc5" /LENGTH=520 /DNA_ID=CAMNT_0015366919 /DNA_START=660 /DNA_END=2222 /DNA_ORIENTATION=+
MEDIEGETIMFLGVKRSEDIEPNEGGEMDKEIDLENAKAEVSEAEEMPDEPTKVEEEAEEDPEERGVGNKVWLRDMHNVMFSPQSTFCPEEIVIVPRSAGGFTYGKILSSWECPCPLGKHKHPGWRVIISERVNPRIVKDLLSVNIGKLHLAALSVEELSRMQMQTPVITPKHNPRSPPKERFSADSMSDDVYNRNAPEFTEARRRGGSSGNTPNLNFELENEEGHGLLIPHGNYEFQDVGYEVPADEKPGSYSHAPVPFYDFEEEAIDPYEFLVPQVPEVRGETEIDAFGGLFPSTRRGYEPSKDAFKQDTIDTSASPQKGSAGIISVPNHVDTSAPVPSQPNNSRKRRQKKSFQNKPVVILDAPNIAMKHGKNKRFSVAGIEIAAKYYQERGHDVVGFIPQHYATKKPAHGELKLQEFLPMADDLPYLNRLIDQGLIVLTPAQDYDDSYCIEYGKSHAGVIVSNDRYWDHIDKYHGKEKEKVKNWIRKHSISFTFVRNEFLPNPDFVFPNASYKNRKH